MKKIAWCTPFSAASSISEFSHTLIENHNSDSVLNTASKIDVLVNESGSRYRSSSKCVSIREILRSPDAIKLFADHYDHVFYNLGNNKENHQDIFELSRMVPGIAILHDYVYQHYLAGRIFTDSNAPNVYAYLMGRHYGAAGLSSVYASQILRPRDSRIGLWDTDLTSKYPMIEAIVANPMHKGIVVHSEMGQQAVKSVYDGPILQLRLPGDEKESPTFETCAKWREDTARRSRVTIGLIGHVQRGKQIHRLIEAIFTAPYVAEMIQSVIIAGKPSDSEYVEHLRRMVAEHPLGSLIRLEFNVSHDRLQEIKDLSDFFVNMRYPNTEGGSGSLIEQMACNKPVIVLDSGIFSEVNKGVIKISHIEDQAALQHAIYDLASSADLRIKLGNEAREYAKSYLSKDYIRDITAFSESIKEKAHPSSLFDVHEILLYDAETRGPEPIFSWEIDSFSEFSRILFQQHFEAELINYLSKEAKSNPINAYKRYSFARTILSFFDHAAKGEECKYWLFPVDLTFEDCYVLACLKERSFHLLAGIFSKVDMPIIRQWTTVVNRFSATTTLHRLALLMSVWNEIRNETLNGEAAEFQKIALETVSTKFTDAVRLVTSLSDEDFIVFLLNEWRAMFDSKKYQQSYPDLYEKTNVDHEILVRHYEMHGRQEGRIARASSQQLLSLSKSIST